MKKIALIDRHMKKASDDDNKDEDVSLNVNNVK